MPRKLTVKQEGFCLAVAEGKSQADAYRANYNAEKMTDKSVHESAAQLAANTKVASRIAELRAMAAERTLVTVETLTLELDENRAEARKFKQASAMVAATMGKAKLLGFLVDRAELTGRDGGPVEVHAKRTIDLGKLTLSEKRALLAAIEQA